MSDPWIDRLSDYVDGELDRDTRQALRRHLEGCAECRAVVDDYERLRSWADEFAAGAAVRPAETRDSWPAIARTIGREPKGGGWTTFRWWAAGGLMAAAALAAVIFVPRRPDSGSPPRPAAPLASADSALEAQWHELRPQLGGQAATTVAEALATIDVSLAELTAALDNDPGNPLLRTLYQRALADKVTVLMDATTRRISLGKG